MIEKNLSIVPDRDIVLRQIKIESKPIRRYIDRTIYSFTMQMVRPRTTTTARQTSESDQTSAVESPQIQIESEFELKVFPCTSGVFFCNLQSLAEQVMEF